jgi:type IV pilus assembly protein PilA
MKARARCTPRFTDKDDTTINHKDSFDVLKMPSPITRDERGFTLIELLVVIIIIGILAAIAIPLFLDQRRLAVDAAVKSDVRNTATQVQQWRLDHGTNSNATPVAYIADGGKLTATKDNGYLGIVTAADGSYQVCGYNENGKALTGPGAAFVFDSITGQFGVGDGCYNAVVKVPTRSTSTPGTITTSGGTTSVVGTDDTDTTGSATPAGGSNPAAGGYPVYTTDPKPGATSQPTKPRVTNATPTVSDPFPSGPPSPGTPTTPPAGGTGGSGNTGIIATASTTGPTGGFRRLNVVSSFQYEINSFQHIYSIAYCLKDGGSSAGVNSILNIDETWRTASGTTVDRGGSYITYIDSCPVFGGSGPEANNHLAMVGAWGPNAPGGDATLIGLRYTSDSFG